MPKISFALTSEPIQKVFDAESYASFNRLCVDSVRGTLVGHSQAEANNEILKKIRQVMNLSDEPTIFDVKHALAKTANREAMFEIISEVVNDTLVSGWQTSPYFNAFVDYRSMALGQTNTFYVEDKTDIVVSEVAASNHDITRQRPGVGTEYSVTVRNYAAKVYMEAERYLMGQEDFNTLVQKISKAFTNRVFTMIHDALLSASASLPTPSQWNLTMELTEANRSKLVKLLSDVSIATGTQARIMGTSVALDGLQDMVSANIFAEAAKEDIYNFGRIGHFGKYEIVEIPQAFVQNDTSTYLYDDTKLLIMPGYDEKFIKMYDEGDTLVYQVMDRDTHIDHTFDYEVTRKMGVGVVTSGRFGMVTIGA